MTIEREDSDIVFVCDTCEKRLETNTDEWSDALSIAKRAEWQMKKIGRDWLHGCQDCGVD